MSISTVNVGGGSEKGVFITRFCSLHSYLHPNNVSTYWDTKGMNANARAYVDILWEQLRKNEWEECTEGLCDFYRVNRMKCPKPTVPYQ